MKRGSNAFALILMLLTGARLATTHPSTTASAKAGSTTPVVHAAAPRLGTADDPSCEAFADLPSQPVHEDKGQITGLVERFVDSMTHPGRSPRTRCLRTPVHDRDRA